jgi:UDP:flavonoid glycosyltransferase YjiC (YdhE family)
LAEDDGPLVYLSLGSLASGDIELMQGLIDSLADTPYRVIVSMGPQHDELRLAANMTGDEFLPQASLLPQVDLVITHGGNNTVTESLYYGRPMVVLPVFWDQYDNAQRIHETGFGIRLDTYGHEPAELPAAIGRLLADEALGGAARRAVAPASGDSGHGPGGGPDREARLDRSGRAWLTSHAPMASPHQHERLHRSSGPVAICWATAIIAIAT